MAKEEFFVKKKPQLSHSKVHVIVRHVYKL